MNCKLEKNPRNSNRQNRKLKQKSYNKTKQQQQQTKPNQATRALPGSADPLSWSAFYLGQKKDPMRKQKKEEQCKGKGID